MRRHFWPSVLVALVTAAPAMSQTAPSSDGDRRAVGVIAGSRGAGIEVQYAWSNQLVLRGTVDALSAEATGRYRGFNYRVAGQGRSVGVFADWHPGGTAWLVSGGVFLGEPEVDLSGRPVRAVRVGGALFTPAQIGEVNGGIEANVASPFLGVGYDDTFTADRRWGARVMLGAAFSGTPRVHLASRGGTLSNSRAFLTRLAAEIDDLEDEVEPYSIYPVAQIGLTFRF